MSVKKSKALIAEEDYWRGQRVRYFVEDPLSRVRRKDGPFYGKVLGVTTNESIIEDRDEGTDGRHRASFTGSLMIQADDKRLYDEEIVFAGDCEIVPAVGESFR